MSADDAAPRGGAPGDADGGDVRGDDGRGGDGRGDDVRGGDGRGGDTPGELDAADTATTPSGAPRPGFGPSGYLPDRAARRARKVVLRAPLGLQWVVASVAFGVVVLVAGVVFLTRSGAPEAPWVAIGALDDLGDATLVESVDSYVVTVGGPVLAFTDAGGRGLTWCPQSRRLQGQGGEVWSVTGRGLGVASLPRHPVTVHDGTVYVDPTVTDPGPRPAERSEAPACRPTSP